MRAKILVVCTAIFALLLPIDVHSDSAKFFPFVNPGDVFTGSISINPTSNSSAAQTSVAAEGFPGTIESWPLPPPYVDSQNLPALDAKLLRLAWRKSAHGDPRALAATASRARDRPPGPIGKEAPGAEPSAPADVERRKAAQPTSSAGRTTIVNNRLPISSDQWPWDAIGRVNIATTTQTRFCTGTLIGPRTVVTAAHCLFDANRQEWFKPHSVHFVPGLAPLKIAGHSLVATYVVSPHFSPSTADIAPNIWFGRPRGVPIRMDMVKNDWAILTLQESLPLKPISIEAIHDAELPSTDNDKEIVLPGYGADRPFMLAAHRGCAVKTDVQEFGTGSLVHTCDTLQGDLARLFCFFKAAHPR